MMMLSVSASEERGAKESWTQSLCDQGRKRSRKSHLQRDTTTQHTPLSGPELGVVSEISLGKFSGKQSSCRFGCNSLREGTGTLPEELE